MLIKRALLIACCGYISLSSAQQLPPGVQPGQLERRFEQPKKPRAAIQRLLPEMQAAQDPATDQAVEFVLGDIVIKGTTIYRFEELLPLYQDKLSTKITLKDLFLIAERITDKYRQDGYVLSRAYVPAQNIRDGAAAIYVIEGYISRVTIEGNAGGSRNRLQRYADRITRSVPLHASVLERYLLLSNDMPGIKLRAVMSPATEQLGAAILTLFIEHDTIEGFATLDNRGSEFIGPQQIQAGIVFNSFFGLPQRTQLRAISAADSELQFAELEHAQFINKQGTKLSLVLRNTAAEPGFAVATLEIETDSNSGSITVEHPFVRSRPKSIYGRVELDHFDSETTVLGALFTEDKIRSLRIGINFDFVDRHNNINLIDLQLSQGLDVLDAIESGSANLSRDNGRSDYTKLNIEVLRLQRLAQNWNLQLGLSVQYAADALLISEQFGLGGANYGRAYDPSEIAGDHGIGFRSEIQYQLSTPSPAQLYSYYDVGAVENRDTDSTTFDSESLASFGIGWRFNITKLFSGGIEFAKPLTRKVAAEGLDGNDARFFFNLVGQF